MKALRLFLSILVLGSACGGTAASGGDPRLPPGSTSPIEPSPAPLTGQPAIAEPGSDAESPVPIGPDDPVWGRPGAPVTIVMFGDYQCPFTARAKETIGRLKTIYGDGKLRVVWKNMPLPFHKNAHAAAEAAIGVFSLAGNDAFWKFHDGLFKNQQALDAENLGRWAAEVGVDGARLRRGLEGHAWSDKVDRDISLAKSIRVVGTPHFFINGASLPGAQPFDKFVELFESELAKAETEIAKGASPERIYYKMSKLNFANPPPKKEEPAPEEDKTVWKVAMGNSPVLGPDTALVTIVEFADFQCPYCKRVLDTLKRVRDTYGNDVRFVWKNEPLPFHQRAEPAAELAEFGFKQRGNAAFWALHDRLFELQSTLEDADLEGAARGAGLDVPAAMQAVHGHAFKSAIDADADMAEDLKATGIPTFFVNGRRIMGSQPFEKFQPIIDEQLELAKALVSRGTPAKKVYEQVMKTATQPEPPPRKNVPLPARPLPFKGAARAKVVIQEFADFQCPFSKKVRSTLSEILATYGGRVKVVFRNKPLPMHPDAPLAAEAALEAFKQKGSDGFWKMHDLLFDNQDGPDGLKQPALAGYANAIGLDTRAFVTALEKHTHQAEVDGDAAAFDAADITGTPAFIVNGYFISGAQPFAKFRRIIDRTLAEAK